MLIKFNLSNFKLKQNKISAPSAQFHCERHSTLKEGPFEK